MKHAPETPSLRQPDLGNQNIAGRIRRAAIRAGIIKSSERTIAQLPATQRLNAFEIIRNCRALPATRESKESTKLDYSKKLRFLTKGLEHQGLYDELPVLLSRLTRYIGAPNSFRGYKSAVCWSLRQEIQADLARQDRLQRDGCHALSWLAVVWRLDSMRKLLIDLEKTTISDAFWANLEVERLDSGSKRHDLRTLNLRRPHWLRQFMLGMRRTKYYDVMRALVLLGCRPEELLKGIVVRRAGPDAIGARIDGAKITQISGQPWREFTFDASAIPRAWIRCLDSAGEFLIKIESKDALRSSMATVSERVFPGLPRVTPYLLRHLFASRLRDGGAQAEELAAALGHLVSETQTYYGFRKVRGTRRKPSKRLPSDVTTARLVRPLDRSGLSVFTGVTARRSGDWSPN